MTKKTNMQSMAIISLILNLGLPGLGSVIAGKRNVGIPQLLLSAAGGLFATLSLPNLLVGFVVATAWIWALLTSVELLKAAFQK